jgi:hypothetical protein
MHKHTWGGIDPRSVGLGRVGDCHFGIGNTAYAACHSVEQFRASPPPSATARIAGYVIRTYLCPPCPKGAMCKPCATHSAVYLADTIPTGEAPSPVIVGIEVADPTVFRIGALYLFDVAIAVPNADIVGRALSSKPFS